MLYADLILPVPLHGVFTYSVPDNFAPTIKVGMMVMVQFGNRKVYPAIVSALHNNEPSKFKTKDILSIVGNNIIVSAIQLKFWNWLADYYMCTPGDIFKSAIPSGLRPTADQSKPLAEKRELFICSSQAIDNEKLEILRIDLKRAPRQLEILESYINLSSDGLSGSCNEIAWSTIKSLTTGNLPALKGLEKKGILTVYKKSVPRIDGDTLVTKELSKLNLHQTEAFNNIKLQFEKKNVVLLNGVTSAGKTEIYIHLIKEQLEKGNQVLYLLPEIALTAQIIDRLKSVFGNRAGVYHSKFNDSERAEIWNRVLHESEHGYNLILGVRSSLFLPFRRLGLIIVDEEHENTFKQFDPAPRYHARDAAIVLASMHKSKTLLGTATPSVETWYNVLTSKYGIVTLTKRYEEIELPEIVVADTREARKRRKMKSLFTPQLINEMEEALSRKEQIILFQNRRGYAPFIECDDCGWIPACDHCDVSMTCHKKPEKLICHYCGSSERIPEVCSKCGSQSVRTKGFGTEKIEDEISTIFPEAKISRLDLDAAKKRRSYEKIISDFECGNTDILVGTQMVAKGLDFAKVSLVGIMNADNLLMFPDFRAHERSFQLILQVSGRSGRKSKRGKVVIQTGFPQHDVIKNVLDNNFETHFKQMLAERREFNYPPFSKLIRVTIKSKMKNIVDNASLILADNLKSIFGTRVLGPEYPVIGRIQNNYIKQILIKIERGANFGKARSILTSEIEKIQKTKSFSSCQIYADVDPA